MYMKRTLILILLLAACAPLFAQVYGTGDHIPSPQMPVPRYSTGHVASKSELALDRQNNRLPKKKTHQWTLGVSATAFDHNLQSASGPKDLFFHKSILTVDLGYINSFGVDMKSGLVPYWGLELSGGANTIQRSSSNQFGTPVLSAAPSLGLLVGWPGLRLDMRLFVREFLTDNAFSTGENFFGYGASAGLWLGHFYLRASGGRYYSNDWLYSSNEWLYSLHAGFSF